MEDPERKCGRCNHEKQEHERPGALCSMPECECAGFIPGVGMTEVTAASTVLILAMIATEAEELVLKQDQFYAPGSPPADYKITVKKL